MKRRSFLSLSVLSAASAPLVEGAASDSGPDTAWYGTVSNDTLEFTAKSIEEKLVLRVTLILPADDEVTEIEGGEGKQTLYRYRGKDLPPGYWFGRRLLTRFELVWDGKEVPIAERFWSDLAGLDIETSTLDISKFTGAKLWEAEQFLKNLRRPRVTLSAEGGTALIEWVRPEECDGRSTIRWIVSKSGNVMRHRDEPPHEC